MARDDDDDGQEEAHLGDEWIVAHWFLTGWSVRFAAIMEKDGKPRTDWHPTDSPMTWYRWKSYHAARKWLRENPKCTGYVVVNLSELERMSKAWHRFNYRSQYKEGGGPLE